MIQGCINLDKLLNPSRSVFFIDEVDKIMVPTAEGDCKDLKCLTQ